MNRGQLILFLCFSWFAYSRAIKARRNPLLWLPLSWLSMAVGFYGTGLSLFFALTALGADPDKVMPLCNLMALGGAIAAASIVAWRAGREKPAAMVKTQE